MTFLNKKRLVLIPIFVVLLLVFLVLLIFSSKENTVEKKQEVTKETETKKEIINKGVNYLPKGNGVQDIKEFFQKAKETGAFVTWAGDWLELHGEKSPPSTLFKSIEKQGFEPVIIASYYNQGAKELLRPTTEENLKKYKEAAATFAQDHQPDYMGFGLEINILAEESPSEFDKFVTVFNETYDLVKSKSPNTKVFTTFQLERIKGLKGGLFGGINDEAQNSWSLLEHFDKADFIAFTTYPFLIYKAPGEIPPDYYPLIKTKTNKPIAFVEVSWASDLKVSGWETTETEQSLFVKKFFESAKTLEPLMIIWPFLYDPPVGEPFGSIGLHKKDSTPKPAWEVWLKSR